MTKYKFLSLLLSLVALSALAMLVANGIGTLERRPQRSSRALLEAGVSRVEATVGATGIGLPEQAVSLANNRDLSAALIGLERALKIAKPLEERPAPQQSRIDKAAEKLDEYRESFRSTHDSISGVTFTDETGVVLKTDSAIFREGETVALLPTKTPPLTGEEDEELINSKGTLVDFALAGHTLAAMAVADGRVYYVASSPVYHAAQKKKVIGVALVDRRLNALPPTPGVDAIMMAGGDVVIGEAPAGFTEPGNPGQEAFLAVPSDPPAQPLGLFELPYMQFLGGEQKPGIYARRFAVPGTLEAWGYVFTDLTLAYREIRGHQTLVALAALLVWLLHVVLILLDGRALRKGVVQIADFLGQVTQGTTDVRSLPERKLATPLRRLTRLINQILEHYVGGTKIQPLTSSPTVDDVLSKTKVDETVEESTDAPDFDGLEFKGIEDSGTLDVGSESQTRELEPGEVGEPSDGYDDSIAEIGDEVVDATTVPNGMFTLPEEETGDAIDHLDDGFSTRTPPPPPAAEIGEPFGDDEFGPPPDHGERTTEMMQVTPDLIEQLKTNITSKRMPPTPPDTDAELAEPEEHLEATDPFGMTPPPPPGRSPRVPPPPPDNAFDTSAVDDSAPTAVMRVTPEDAAQMKAESHEAPDVPTRATAAAADADGGTEATRQAHFKEVYEAFVKARKECGEKGELAFEKFAGRLAQSRAAVMQKHKCHDVRFQVYVKNGKAALKATPAK